MIAEHIAMQQRAKQIVFFESVTIRVNQTVPDITTDDEPIAYIVLSSDGRLTKKEKRFHSIRCWKVIVL